MHEHQTTTKPRILYLAYNFRPAQTIATVRTWNTATHLLRLGWDVTVVTPDPHLWVRSEDIATAEREISAAGIKRLLTGHDWPMLVETELRYSQHPVARLLGGLCRRLCRARGTELQIGWVRAVERACAHLRPGDVDLVLATGMPYIAFRLARRLAQRLNCPYVLDYRDLWNGNPYRGDQPPNSRAVREEALLLRDAAAVTIISPSSAESLGRMYGHREKIHVITNGYDEAMFADITPEAFGHFAVVYAGVLYPPRSRLDPVLAAFGRFLEAHPGCGAKLHYYGTCGKMVQAAAERLTLGEHVLLHGSVSRKEALAAQRGANVGVVITSIETEAGPAMNGVLTGKMFDCMALGRPMLVVAPRGGDIYTIAETTSHIRCFIGQDLDGMAAFLGDCLRGQIEPTGNLYAYTWTSISQRLDALLRSLLPAADCAQPVGHGK